MNTIDNRITDSLDVLNKRFFRTEEEKIYKTIHFYLGTDIGEPEEYFPMIHEIRTAQDGDVIHIHLNVTGGILATGVQIIAAMKSSAATIITSIEGECHSLGTLIFLSGDEFIVSQFALAMFHNYSGESYGKGNERYAEVIATNDWFGRIAATAYKDFLTDEEINSILKGSDLWMNDEEIVERLTAMESKTRRNLDERKDVLA